jgi:hypothetical protein
VSKGLLHSLGYRDYWSAKPGYLMASETASWAAPILALQAARQAGKPFFIDIDPPPADHVSLAPVFLSDLVRVVGELGRKSAGITQSGTVYRRDVDRLHRLLTPQRLEAVSPAFSRIMAGMPDAGVFGPWAGEAPADLGVILWLGFGLGLIEVREGEIVPARDWRKRLGRRTPGEIVRRSVLAVWDLHARSLAALYWLRFLAPQYWLAPLRLLEASRLHERDLFDAQASVEAASVLRALGQLGALEVASMDGEPVVRLTPLAGAVHGEAADEPQLAGRWSILPSGDILVPPDVPPTALAWLETVARPSRVDVVSTYEIRQETLHHGIELGVKPDEILTELEGGSRTGLPQAVRFRIEEWLGRVGRFRFVEAAMLVCRTPADAQAALAVKGVRQEVIEVVGETCLVIAAAHEERVRQALERGGFAALQGVFAPSGLYREDALRERRRSQRSLRSLDWGQGTVIEAL